ncbi:hypothetical protein ES708_30091 [subsurface metagenome]
MLSINDTAHVVTQITDLRTDLANGNVPGAEKLITQLGNFLPKKQPLEWEMLAAFLIDHLKEAETRVALMHFLGKINELLDPFRPDQEED